MADVVRGNKKGDRRRAFQSLALRGDVPLGSDWMFCREGVSEALHHKLKGKVLY